MRMIAECVGAVSLAVWVYLILARGGFWRLRGIVLPSATSDVCPPAVAVIVPARNEADVVGPAMQSLLTQDYTGRLHVFLVDDHSSDGTAEVARGAAREINRSDRLTVVQASPLPKGWTGKVWALSEGLKRAAGFGADYFLLADADMTFAPNAAASLVCHAEAGELDLVSVLARLSCESFAERAIIPSFVFFFFMLYPPAWVERPNWRTAAAAGGCILVRAEALARIGGIASVRSEVIEDCALARAVKQSGRTWLGLGEGVRSLRAYSSWSEIERMISRTAFTELRHSALLLAATIVGMTLVFLAPPALLFLGGRAAGLGLCAWLLMGFAFWPTLRHYGRSRYWAPLLPLMVVFYLAATIHSACRYWQGHGGMWKGRIQDPSRD
jgi:hopene-associated glycosyltransferase HpnB